MSNVLIIDDDNRTTVLLASLLENQGHCAVAASSAAAALTHLRQRSVDLILLDLMIPGTTGPDIFQALSNEVRSAGIPLAIYSGESPEAAAEVAQRLGAVDVIPKGMTWPKTYE